jgi:hypothetical protein
MSFKQEALDDPNVQLWLGVIQQAMADLESPVEPVRADALSFFMSDRFQVIKELLRDAVFEEPTLAPPAPLLTPLVCDEPSARSLALSQKHNYDDLDRRETDGVTGLLIDMDEEDRLRGQATHIARRRAHYAEIYGVTEAEYVAACRAQRYRCDSCGRDVQRDLLCLAKDGHGFLHFDDERGHCWDCY